MKKSPMPIHGMGDFSMTIESVYIGMPVYHKDGSSYMKVRQVLPTGNVVCAWTEPDGREVEQTFPSTDLELGAHKMGDLLLTGL